MVSAFDAYPISWVDELIDRVGNAQVLSTIDLNKGYWQISLDSEDQPWYIRRYSRVCVVYLGLNVCVH